METKRLGDILLQCQQQPGHNQSMQNQDQIQKFVPSLLTAYKMALKMQSKIEIPIEGDKAIEDRVTQWQEFTTIKQEDPDSKVSVTIHLDAGNKFIVSFC